MAGVAAGTVRVLVVEDDPTFAATLLADQANRFVASDVVWDDLFQAPPTGAPVGTPTSSIKPSTSAGSSRPTRCPTSSTPCCPRSASGSTSSPSGIAVTSYADRRPASSSDASAFGTTTAPRGGAPVPITGVIFALEAHLDLPRQGLPNLSGRWFALDDAGLRAGERVVLVGVQRLLEPGRRDRPETSRSRNSNGRSAAQVGARRAAQSG